MTRNSMKALASALLIAICVGQISACSIYRLGSRQGNEVTAEKLQALEDALTREQVVEIMGTPLVTDPFRNDRWDYVYYYSKRYEETKLRRITIFFNEDLVARIQHTGIDTSEQNADTDVDSDVGGDGIGPETDSKTRVDTDAERPD
jgi:outer membrane protein assembly factor BamE